MHPQQNIEAVEFIATGDNRSVHPPDAQPYLRRAAPEQQRGRQPAEQQRGRPAVERQLDLRQGSVREQGVIDASAGCNTTKTFKRWSS